MGRTGVRPMTVAYFVALLAAICLALAAYSDVRSFRIPNIYPIAIIALFIGSRLWWGFTSDDWAHLLHFAVALAVGMGLFAAKWIGGGDAKLYAATALWFSGSHVALLIFATGIAGGVLAIGYVLFRKFGRRDDGRPRTERRIAYGLAIACGGIVVGAMAGLPALIPGA